MIETLSNFNIINAKAPAKTKNFGKIKLKNQFVMKNMSSILSVIASVVVGATGMTVATGANAQVASIVKCEKDGVVEYRAWSGGNADKACGKIEVYISNNQNVLKSNSDISPADKRASSNASSSSGGAINGASILSSFDSSASNQRNRDVRRSEILAQELGQENSALDSINQQILNASGSVLEALQTKKTITLANITALKKELAKMGVSFDASGTQTSSDKTNTATPSTATNNKPSVSNNVANSISTTANSQPSSIAAKDTKEAYIPAKASPVNVLHEAGAGRGVRHATANSSAKPSTSSNANINSGVNASINTGINTGASTIDSKKLVESFFKN